MEKLVDIVLYLNREIHVAFCSPDGDISSKGSLDSQPRLGPAGLALHYANIVLQIDSIVSTSLHFLILLCEMLIHKFRFVINFALFCCS
ncbi:unnamed protein product [Ilex paraguariensis]|uniref:DUF668 domain-containing protein n=1 Tax=Ilex paraguariensis TaxID=185542 RepID=A0ABC8T9U8_9AQUA